MSASHSMETMLAAIPDRIALDDAWVSTDGLNRLQIKPALNAEHVFRGRGAHSAIVIHSNSFNQQTVGIHDRMVILGGETSNPKQSNTRTFCMC